MPQALIGSDDYHALQDDHEHKVLSKMMSDKREKMVE